MHELRIDSVAELFLQVPYIDKMQVSPCTLLHVARTVEARALVALFQQKTARYLSE